MVIGRSVSGHVSPTRYPKPAPLCSVCITRRHRSYGCPRLPTAATDFFTVEVLTRTGLVRYLVLVIIKLDSRRVEIAGIAPDPDGPWMKQVARNLTDVEDGALTGVSYLIHDRDPLFTREFIDILSRPA